MSLCIGKILRFTSPSDYWVFVWNNNYEDSYVPDFLRFLPNCTLIQAPADRKFKHIHAGPLQELYELVRSQKFKYIVALDSDAHPIKSGWLNTLTSALDEGAALAGVWRNELSIAIAPYIHASCFATTIQHIECTSIRLDFIAPNENGIIHDTLSAFTAQAKLASSPLFKLERSNKRQFHRLMGGVYGDLIYHHGAGSRQHITFWDEEKNRYLIDRNNKISEASADLLFSNYQHYMSWLRGEQTDAAVEAALECIGLY